MVSRAHFLGTTALGVLAATLASPAQAAEAGSRMLIATEHGVVAGGDSPTNARINELISQLADAGGGSLIFPPGIYNVDSAGIVMGNQVTIMGLGESTQFRPVGDWSELAGVFRIGTDKAVSQTPVFRTGLHNLSIKAGLDPIRHTEPKANVVGILYNTFNGDDPGDPDAAHRISGITLWDLDMGIKLKGPDDQGCTVSDIRGRRFLRTALTVGDTEKGTGADNFFSTIDVSSANLSRWDAAAVEVYASNCSFSQVKSWYAKRASSFNDSAKAGAGFYVAATRNTFNQCDAQDNGGHGFVLDLGNNSLVNCIADSNGYAENVSDKANTGEAHGFHISENAPGTQLIGCQAFNRVKDSPGQAIGFWISDKNTDVTLIGSAFRNTLRASSTGSLEKEQKVLIGSVLG